LTGKRLGGRGRGGSSGTWHAIAFDRRNPFVCVTTVILYYCLNLTQIHREIIESLINGTDRPAANRRTH